MTNNEKGLSSKIKVGGQELKVVSQFQYIDMIISKEGSRIEILSSAA